MKWLREIRKVGLRDWLWFVVWIRRDEFSRKLDLNRYYPDMKRLVRDRNRAHRLDMEIGAQRKNQPERNESAGLTLL
mgnify:CR=1 FL=1